MEKETIQREETPAVHVEDMTMAYDQIPVIWDVDVDIPEQSITAIVGPNGAGKSTLLKGILGILRPLSGEVKIFGRPYKEIYKRIAYIPQSGSVNWNFPTTVEDVVLMGRYVHTGPFRRYSKKDRETVLAALTTVGMDAYLKRHISALSGGQKQRVFLARAIAQDADLYFMDEPLQGVDIKTEEIIMDTIRRFQKAGKTTVAVHHDLNTISRYFDHVILLNKQLIAAGRVDAVFTEENLKRTYGE